jgi:Holliday junction resolvasome RuvABC endonuclease subunit
MSRILGLDLALRNVGAVLIPTTWNLDWSDVIHAHYTSKRKEGTLVERDHNIRSLVEQVCLFAEVYDATHVWIEDYAFRARAGQSLEAAELCGCVRWELRRRLDIPVAMAPQATMRKLITGNGRAPKELVHETLLAMGAPWKSDHESDAFAAANYGLSELGFRFVGGGGN